MNESGPSHTPRAPGAPASVGLDVTGFIGHASGGDSNDGVATMMNLLGFGQLHVGHAVQTGPVEHRSGLSGRQHGLEGSLSTHEMNIMKSHLNPLNDTACGSGSQM